MYIIPGNENSEMHRYCNCGGWSMCWYSIYSKASSKGVIKHRMVFDPSVAVRHVRILIREGLW